MIAATRPAPSRPPQLPDIGVDGATLTVPRRSLVLVAGLPGAGKTTLVRRLGVAPGVHALDAEDVAGVLARVPLPYRSVRPLVHLVHLLRLLLTLTTPAGCVLSSDPLTSTRRRAAFAAAAALTGRRLVVVLLHTAAQDARDGQRRRGRVLTEARMTRHEHRYAKQLRAGWLHTADHALSRTDAALLGISTTDAARDKGPAQATHSMHPAAAQRAARTTSDHRTAAQPERALDRPQPRTRPSIQESDRDTRPRRSRRTPPMSAEAGRHVRPGRLVLIGATVLGLWFGLTAPAVSPVLPEGAIAVQFVDVGNETGDGDGDGDGRGGEGGRRR